MLISPFLSLVLLLLGSHLNDHVLVCIQVFADADQM